MLNRIFITMIRTYQTYISPLLRPRCRYYPTCSSYAIQSLEKYGFFKGSFKAVWRILRCNPFSKGGIDYP